MNGVKEKNPTQALWDAIYKNVKMGADSIVNLMSRVEDQKLKDEMVAQLNRYEEYAKKVGSAICECGETPKEENVMTRMSAKVGMAMNTMTDSTSSHLAQMIIEGATMGITELTRLVREYENTTCAEDALATARDVIRFEESTVHSMKKFL